MTSASRIKDKCVARGNYLLTHSDDASKKLTLFQADHRYNVYRFLSHSKAGSINQKCHCKIMNNEYSFILSYFKAYYII